MKVQIKISPSTIVEVEAANTRDLVAQVAHVQEVFGYSKCGVCGAGIRYVVRQAQGYTFYEIRCVDRQRCGARLSLGQPKASPEWLFPSRKAKDGSWLPNDGWTIWKGSDEQSQAQHAPTDDQYQQQDGPQYEA
jgi:hypothetical protein